MSQQRCPSSALVAGAPSHVDLYEEILELASRAAERYHILAQLDPTASPIGRLCAEPAARWAAERAVVGQSLPVNAATVRALKNALRQLDAVDLGAE